MKKADAVRHFGSQANLARVLKVSEALVSRWPDVVPFKWALSIEDTSQGQVKLELNDYRNRK